MSSGAHVRGNPWLIQVLTPVAVLVTAVVGVRFSLRVSRRTGFWLDDWFILASLVFAWGMYIISVLTVEIGGNGTPYLVNEHIDPSKVWMEHLLKLLYASQMVYACGIMTAKLSILALYWRLFPTITMKRGCLVLAALTIMWCIAGVLVDIFQCTPVGKAFDISLPEGHCISQVGYCLGMIIPNILIDVAILCLPTFEVSKLHLPRGQRCALASVFLLGAGVTSAGGVRMYYHLELVESADKGDFDFTMDLFNPQLWMTLEPDMAVICACLPVMRPLLTMLLASPLYRSIASYLTTGSSASRSGKLAASNTIGGSSAAPSNAAQRGTRDDDNNRASDHHHSGYALSSFDSLEYLQDEDVEAGRLVRNRGIWPSRGRLNIKTVAIYTEPDSASQHVADADVSYLLDGDATRAYLDGDQIILKAKTAGAQAIIPGYGFLSEDASFARSVAAAGLQFVGPSSESIEQFGLKHTARELALAAGVPVVPGTQGLLSDAYDAARAAGGLGYPVMLKSTAGGGGMGLQTCGDETQLRKAFETVRSRGAALFKNAGVFLERYYPAAHHIEVQVFGNGRGGVAALGERECSIQRRHQKVIEECPSPFVAQKRPELRRELCAAATSLAESVKYASAGTLEFLVDDESGAFFFLEMNTRLQVEHGVTEMVYGVDLVELMLRQAEAQMAGKGGLEEAQLEDISRSCQEPKGHAIEVRVYAENPARDYAPSPGLLQQVVFHELPGTRIDGWVRAGITISPNYDPLLAKVIHHAQDRSRAMEELKTVLSKSSICGPPTNLDFLLAILGSPGFESGNTITQFLSTFVFRPSAIDVLAGGSYTLVEDFPGRPTIGKGFGHGGPMDPISFQIANALVGNILGKEGLEITLTGPDLRFLGDAMVSLTGASISATLDGKEFPMWQRMRISAGQRLTIGKTLSNAGCRSYLAVYGGFLNVAEWFGSKATVPLTLVGGYQGRPIATGDLLRIVDALPPEPDTSLPRAIPDTILPKNQEHWVLNVMHGPYCEGYLSPEDIETFYSTDWEVSHNAARGGIRLIGPRPKWARTSGGEGGSHPSNVIEYGYPIGGINFTGDEPVIFPNDCPDFGGFVCPFTVVKADYWKVGQLRAGNKVKFVAVSLEDALWSRKANEAFVDNIVKWLASGSYESVQQLDATPILEAPSTVQPAVIRLSEATPSRPRIAYLQGGDDYLLVDYGHGSFDINHKCRITALKRKLEAGTGPIRFSPTGEGIYNTVCVGNSMTIYYNGLAVPQSQLLDYLAALEDELGDLSAITMPNRTFRLPLTFSHPRLDESIERYMANQRPYASYLPDNFRFVAENNSITPDEFRRLWLTAEFVCVGVGFFMALPLGLPADPRHRLNSPKMNPSRTFTPEGTVSWGGSCLAIYPVDSPGGYMLNGLTLPSCDKLGYKRGFSQDRPWLYEDMDVITFYEVSEEEYDREIALFRSGRYEFKVESTTFDMKQHNELLESVKDEVEGIKKKQEEAQEKMVTLEKELLAKWDEEKKAGGVSMESIQSLLDDPNIEAIEAPVNANVWKVLVEEGQVLEKGQVATILEAMKMEINVAVDDRFAGSKIEKVLIQPNDIVQSGKPLVLVRTGV